MDRTDRLEVGKNICGFSAYKMIPEFIFGSKPARVTDLLGERRGVPRAKHLDEDGQSSPLNEE